ncbi:hypothetical protein D9611_000453 [Ephemerocybe angulata]|uniref:Rho-GAP domain-containing protein n=1 Tax=Ephemerocybe angulata TaxID=980116 RepID=A0A8H5F7E5_9AGAR|nr:hypothetical protein D9611_000453 [Tulosesus angulatus]
MSVSNPAVPVTSATGGTNGGPIHSNSTAAPSSPPASSQAGSSYAPESSVSSLNPTTTPSGFTSSSATLAWSSSSTPPLGDPASKNGDNTTNQAPAISSTPRRPLPSTSSAGGPRSNSFSSQSLEQYPPSSTPVAAGTPPTAAASLPKWPEQVCDPLAVSTSSRPAAYNRTKATKSEPTPAGRSACSTVLGSAIKSLGWCHNNTRSRLAVPFAVSHSLSVTITLRPTITVTTGPGIGPTSPPNVHQNDISTSSKLKRAFGARRKKSEDVGVSLLGKAIGGASTTSLTQQARAPELEGPSKSTSQRQLAAQLLGPSATASSSGPLKKVPSKPFLGSPITVPARSEVAATHAVHDGDIQVLTTSSLASIDTLQPLSGSSKAEANRASIIQLSPGITSAVDYMREMGLSEQVRAGSSSNGIGAGIERSNQEKPDQEDDSRREEGGGGNDGDCGKADEGGVEPVQQLGDVSPPLSSPSGSLLATPASSSFSSSFAGSSAATTPSSTMEREAEYQQRGSREQEREKGELKENWRKSDSTIGHHTFRNAGAVPRPSRPVSMAESFQSAYTIVPNGGGSGPGSIGGNKRWSTVTGELDFQVMMEDPAEEEEDTTAAGSSNLVACVPGSQPFKGEGVKPTSSTPSAKSINRRSLSLNVGIASSAKPQVTPAYVNVSSLGQSHRTTEVEAQPISYSISESHATAAATSVASSPPHSSSRSGTNTRGLPPQQSLGALNAQPPHIPPHSSSNHQHQHRQHQHTISAPLNIPSGTVPAWSVTPPSATLKAAPPVSLNSKLPPPSMSSQQSHGMSGSLLVSKQQLADEFTGLHSNAPVSFRQTAISMSNGFAKRAAEKIGGIGKKWGISASSSTSGYSSTSSSSRDQGAAPSSFSSSQSHLEQGGIPLARTHSNQSSMASSMKSAASLSSGIASGIIHHVHLPGHKDRANDKKKRRTPNAPSGAYSVASSVTSASTSESDNFTTSGPVLGKLVRGPVASSGVVFGRDLRTVVNLTKAVNTLSEEKGPENRMEGEREKLVKDLETRMLPALVTRCAQHILIWGIQEEGLFRVSGRASHVTKLRSEFDTGADCDLTDSSPGDLDPHAVASVFKAYLRELPEHLLTARLQRTFEAALTRELATYPPQSLTTKITTRVTPGLPSGPKSGFNSGIRKPPSLSTLAMPSFNGMPAASSALVYSLRTLIAQLPQENRDLTRTVVELIQATASASKDTKMPLSNLLLVFCPSLNMSPPLLKALCEAQGIWDELPDPDEVLDISGDPVILDISADTSRDGSERGEDDYADAREGVDSERQSLQSVDGPCSEGQSSEYNASAENSMLEETSSVRRELPKRPTVPTVYLDSQSHYSSSSLSSSHDARRDTVSPALVTSSESVDSLVTPVSSGHPSLSYLPLQDSKKEPLAKKKISMNDLKVKLESPSPGTSPDPRDKRPSLRNIFTKRSVASLRSGSQSRPKSTMFLSSDGVFDLPPSSGASDSSVSTPISAVTAPQSSTSLLPPVLDTTIDSSSLDLSLGLDLTDSPPDSAVGLRSPDVRTANTDTTFYASARSSRVSFGTTETSPLDTQVGHNPYRQRQASTLSIASSKLVLSNEDEEEEDWTQSVLIAAGAK